MKKGTSRKDLRQYMRSTNKSAGARLLACFIFGFMSQDGTKWQSSWQHTRFANAELEINKLCDTYFGILIKSGLLQE